VLLLLLLLLPTLCDLLGAALLSIGELWCLGYWKGVLGVGVGSQSLPWEWQCP
jgi:hypothetical protein